MNTAAAPNSQLVLESNALFKQFSLSVRGPDNPLDIPLSALVHDLRECLYLIRRTTDITKGAGLLLNTQAEAYSRQLSSLLALHQVGEASGSVLQVIRDFCDLIQQELGPRTATLAGEADAPSAKRLNPIA